MNFHFHLDAPSPPGLRRRFPPVPISGWFADGHSSAPLRNRHNLTCAGRCAAFKRDLSVRAVAGCAGCYEHVDA
jgi:hypothetical protein